jgi:hypothetical protein
LSILAQYLNLRIGNAPQVRHYNATLLPSRSARNMAQTAYREIVYQVYAAGSGAEKSPRCVLVYPEFNRDALLPCNTRNAKRLDNMARAHME